MDYTPTHGLYIYIWTVHIHMDYTHTHARYTSTWTIHIHMDCTQYTHLVIVPTSFSPQVGLHTSTSWSSRSSLCQLHLPLPLHCHQWVWLSRVYQPGSVVPVNLKRWCSQSSPNAHGGLCTPWWFSPNLTFQHESSDWKGRCTVSNIALYTTMI